MGFHQAQPTIGKLACNHYRWNTRDAETFYRHVHDGGQGGAGVKSHRRQIGPTEQRSDEVYGWVLREKVMMGCRASSASGSGWFTHSMVGLATKATLSQWAIQDRGI